jgi:hypothetical protein
MQSISHKAQASAAKNPIENPNCKNPIYMQHEKPSSSSSSKGLGFYMHYERERNKMENLFILKQSSSQENNH